ncbi:MAG: hypothetical protein FRX48_06141 [Lasallia pustulata]|uniref:Cytokinesis regulator n=1 Tax=Lasallia pustulata TaxID=136370 RepID=A0A5M8PKF7_9LECA|nr:MAG: hypothetical protein FRX48_06141 [Lasallia pustulata]
MFLREKLASLEAFMAQQHIKDEMNPSAVMARRQEYEASMAQQHVKDEMECWDDDDDLQGIEDLHARAVSTASTTVIASSSLNQPLHRRDSISSRFSARSDVDSNGGGDEDWHVLLPTDDEFSTTTAIASANKAGIPIPANVPSSALLGGTIKRLGGRRIKKVLGGDDWDEDLELPKMEDGGLTLKKTDENDFPDTLGQISGSFSHHRPTATDSLAGLEVLERMKTAQPPKPTMAALDKFRDEEGDDEFDLPEMEDAKDFSHHRPTIADSLAGLKTLERMKTAQPHNPAMAALDKFRDEEGDEEFDLPKMEGAKDFSHHRPTIADSLAGLEFLERMKKAQPPKPAMAALEKFRDEEGDDEFSGDIETIKVAKNRPTPKTINFIPPPTKDTNDEDNFENDFEFPSNGDPLRLSKQKETVKSPPVSEPHDDFDTEWAEGSLGTRFGGTRRDDKSNRSSSLSALSPSVSSCLTAESEDDGLDCLILPDGPLRFEEALKKRLEKVPLDVVDHPAEKQVEEPTASKEDFFAGIDIGDGDVFDSGKLTLNRNIKHKAARQTSPARRTATTLTFTSKPQATTNATRIPKPQGHGRVRSKLEPVSESGGPVPSYQRPRSSHSAKSSLSGIPAPSLPSLPSSSTVTPAPMPNRRGLMSKSSEQGQKVEPTTTGAQLLRSKRSMPVLRGQPSTARSQPMFPRPSSRADHSTRQTIPSRPKTPVDRMGTESSFANYRKPPVPFLPAGSSLAQSHHITMKNARQARRPGSSDSSEQVQLNSRPISRLSTVTRPVSPVTSRANGRKDIAPESLAREAASKRHITKPTRRRAFGDGSELEIFDDLPTSANLESKFVKQPVGRGAPKAAFRSRPGQVQIPSQSRTETPAPRSPTKQDFIPNFARDTNASRIAREQRTSTTNTRPLREAASITTHLAPVREGTATNIHPPREKRIVATKAHPSREAANITAHLLSLREGTATTINPPREVGGPLVSLSSTNSKSAIAAKVLPPIPSLPRTRPRKHAHQPPQKPCLIKPLGDHVNSAKSVNGMYWNPTLFRWEGNENALAPFDAPLPTVQLSPRSSPGVKPAPALIANVGATKGVQVVGGMVFDPQRMCWLKMGPGHESNPTSPDSFEEEEDVFAGLEDLDEGKSAGGRTEDSKGKKSGYGGGDQFPVGEEFDVGPEFVRRQYEEEERWKKYTGGWFGKRRDAMGERHKWVIREIVGCQ